MSSTNRHPDIVVVDDLPLAARRRPLTGRAAQAVTDAQNVAPYPHTVTGDREFARTLRAWARSHGHKISTRTTGNTIRIIHIAHTRRNT